MDENKRIDLEAKWKKVAALAVTDNEFKKKLASDPIAVLSEYGMAIPQGTQARTNAEKEVNLLLPPNPSQELEQEVKWWKRRLDIIRVLNKEDLPERPPVNIPEGCEDV